MQVADAKKRGEGECDGWVLFPSAGGVASEAGRGGLVEQRLAVNQGRKATTPPCGHPSWGGELRTLRVAAFFDSRLLVNDDSGT